MSNETLALNSPLRLTVVFALLSALTALAWWLGAKHGVAPFHPDHMVTYVVVGSALLKVFFIIREFMEVKNAPWLIKGAIYLWFAATIAILFHIYYS